MSSPPPPPPPNSSSNNDNDNNGDDYVLEDDADEALPASISCCACICVCLSCLALFPLLCCCCATAAAADGANTVIQKSQGKRWDAKQEQWIMEHMEKDREYIQNIPENDEDLLGKSGEDPDDMKKPTSQKQVKETLYYDVLGVPTDADVSKIKKAYYLQARKWHPDRRPTSDEEAKQKFQQIGEAYQVLSDPKLRAQYDLEGEAGLSGDRTELAADDQLDPSLVFTFLFGSDAFQNIVGRLQVVTQTMVGADEEDNMVVMDKTMRKMLKELEKRRVVRLAIHLLERIDKYVKGFKEEAEAEWRALAKQLVDVNYGEGILNTVGATYRLTAIQYIGKWGEASRAKSQENNMRYDATANVVKGTIDMRTNQQNSPTSAAAPKEGDSDGANADEAPTGGTDQLPQFLKIMWNVTVIDISSTLHEVVMKVLWDTSVPKDVREQRAAAIQTLGEIFETQKSASVQDDNLRDLYQKATQEALEETLKRKQEEGAAVTN